jgi:3'-phosphoadenosine 5'-phosphosulfate sulfotransferase (PAPS reductase)/FAD synthetase
VKHVIGLSGGKDSTCLALAMRERMPEIFEQAELICTPTGDELPEMHEHWANLERMLGKPLKRLPNDTLSGLIAKQEMLPNFRARWCTRILKIEPTIEYMESLPPGSVQYVGLRADEPERTGIFGEDIVTRFPLREWGWGLKEVWAFLNERGVCIPARTDCARCFYQRLGEWYILWRDNRALFEDAVQQEQQIGATFRTPGRDTWPTSLLELGKRFEKERPQKSLDRMEREAESRCRVCSL